MADQRTVWVQSNLTGDRPSTVTIKIDDRPVRTCDRTEANDYAQAMLAYAQRAEYIAAMFRQLTEELGVAHPQAREIVQGILMGVPSIPARRTAPLVVKLAVGTHVVRAVPGAPQGALLIELNGVRLGRWDVRRARAHALQVLDAVEAADLDTAYLRFLNSMELGRDEAQEMVSGVAAFRG
jgi:hypothetical protein